jgi:hypothetical protein
MPERGLQMYFQCRQRKLDSRNVDRSGRAKFPPTLVDVLEEKGSAGRRPTASAATDWYLVCLSLDTYVHLLHWAANSFTAQYDNNYKSEETLEVLVLPKRCLQLTLETISANPFTPINATIADNRVPCGESCSFCLGDYARIFPKVCRLGVHQVLLGVFVGQHPNQGRPAVDGALVTPIQLFPEVQSIVFGTMDRSRKTPEPQMRSRSWFWYYWRPKSLKHMSSKHSQRWPQTLRSPLFYID